MQGQSDPRGNGAHAGPTYSMGEAARQVGISPSTVRLYEKQGLLHLQRTTGGRRYLTEDDLNVLKRIRTLRRTQGLNVEGIRRGLQSSPAPVRPEVAESQGAEQRAGPRLRVLRQSRGLALREVAKRAGMSPSFLSTFERGLAGISVSNLQRLLSICGSSLVDLFSEPGQEPTKLIRPTERPRLVLDGGAVSIEDLAVVPRQIEVQLWTIQPGAGSDGTYSHAGEEAMYMISGRLEVHLNEMETYSLEPGYCLYFPSTEPHRWRNIGAEAAVVLWVGSPPTF